MKNLKPFDLQAALSGKAVMLRDGTKAYVRHHEKELNVVNSKRLLGYAASGAQRTWCENGSYSTPSETLCRDIIGMYPETRTINGFEVPAPETKKPALDTKYYTPLLTNDYFFCGACWQDDGFHNSSLQRGLVFLNVEDAIATAKAMLGIDPYGETES